MAALTFAAIDVGSFEVEMGIYEISNRNKIRKLDQIRHVTALGKDTYNNGKISYEMVEELCDVLADFARIMKSYKVTEYRAYATSAMREARNNRIVLDQIRVRTGIQVRIISNSEQRFLGYKAIAVSDDEFDENIQQGTAIVDVGFGSMQISMFDKNLLVNTENLPLGVLRIRGTLEEVDTTMEQYRELIDEMVDKIEDVMIRIYINNVQSIRPEAVRLAEIVGKCCTEVQNLLKEFENFKRPAKLDEKIIAINSLEEEADTVYIASMRKLHEEEKDPLEIITWREIYDYLEKCADACEHVADTVGSVIMKNS